MPLRWALSAQNSLTSSAEIAQIEHRRVQLHLPGLDLGKVEDVVDDRKQRFGRGSDGLGKAALALVQRGAGEKFGHAEDAVHRRADLVAHVGEELGFRTARILGRVPRSGQFGDGRLKTGVARLQLGGAGIDLALKLVAMAGKDRRRAARFRRACR